MLGTPAVLKGLINRFSCWAMLAESLGMVNAFGVLRSGWREAKTLLGLLLPEWSM
jgi:hypothetical protein